MGSFGKSQALNKHQIRKMEVARDERGFDKADMQVMDPRQANFQETVNLVERDTCPDGFQLVNPQESGKKTQFDLVELAGAIQTADKFTRATAGSKLSVIAEQVRFLQEQARKVLEEAQRDAEINHMACNFKRIPGKVYYIYRRKTSKAGLEGQKYMSMISPEVNNSWRAMTLLFSLSAPCSAMACRAITHLEKVNKLVFCSRVA